MANAKKKRTTKKVETKPEVISEETPKKEEKVEPVKATPKKQRVRAPRNNLGDSPGSQASFKSWFTNKLEQDSRLKPHHLETIKIYLKGLGIQEGAGPIQYERGLKKYFGEG